MSITTLPLLENLQGPWSDLKVEFVGAGAPAEPTVVRDVYPFTSTNDFKRLLWHQTGGDPRWAPERVFLGVRAAGGGIRPVEFHWPLSVTEGSIDLLDPVPPAARVPSPALIDETGNRRAIAPTMTGTLILEAALSPEILAAAGGLPVVTAISLAALQPVEPEALTAALFGGFYQLYFPWLTAPAQVLDAAVVAPTQRDREAYAAVVPYLEDRTGRIELVQRALATRLRGSQATMATVVRMRWTLPPPSAKPESLEKTFYGLTASATLPFLRFFPVGGKGAPLLKLGLKPDGTPIIDDERALAHHLSIPAPAIKSGVILARVPLTSAHADRGAAFTLYLFDDGNSDITLEVPARGMKYLAAVATDAERLLRGIVREIGFPPNTIPTLRDLHAMYRWTHPDPRRSAPLTVAALQKRVTALTPFLDVVPQIAQDATTAATALATFKWRAVSNYESESAQFAFITQLVLAAEGEAVEAEGAAALVQHVAALQERFGMTQEVALATLERWVERRQEAVAPAAGPLAGALAVPKHSTGTYVTVGGTHPEYTIEIQGADSAAEVQRILSVVGVLLGIPAAELSLAPPPPVVQAAAVEVAVAEAAVEDAAAAAGGAGLDELDPAMAALVGDIDFGLDDFLEEEADAAEGGGAAAPALVVEEVAAPPAVVAAAPNLEAAMAGVEEECRGVRWQPGEAALQIPADYYMVRLKRADQVLFGYSVKVGGRPKGYSKTCQRQDERQPNIMTLSEYARVRRCYRDRVRFVDLPPRSPADLPSIPDFNPRKKKAHPDEYFMTDPATGQPMWTVYGYESKTNPGEYRYLICAELWCERDNLPLIRSEFEGEAGRGFAKPANTCPFCGGKPIAVLDRPQPGESVIVRLPKEATGKIHSFIGTIQVSNKHPEGYPLPCCDTTPRLLKKYLEAQALGTIVYGRDLAAIDEEEGSAPAAAAAGGDADEFAEPPPEEGLDVGGAAAAGGGPEDVDIDYLKILGSMPTQYILGGDKSLDAGKLGLLPTYFDAFFGQDSSRSMERRGIRTTFAAGAHLFVRMGVDNRIRTPGLNLFAALAPLLGFHGAAHTRRSILDVPPPQKTALLRAFEAANYGTLVQEFAARSILSDAEIAPSLATFAGENGYELGPNRAHVARLYKAWVTYLAYLNDEKKPKQLRHIEHILAQPTVLTPRGLLLVVLEYNKDTERVEVVCPSFGIPTASVFGDVPIAFMIHNKADETWEPLVLYNGTRDAVRYFGERSAELELLPRSLRSSLAQWLRDWRSSSLGCGRPSPPPHVWTPDRDTRMLPRLSQLRARGITKLVRDRSNRLAGALVNAGSAAAPQLMFVPCLDDGTLVTDKPSVYEVEMIPQQPLDAYLAFYRELATVYPALAPTELLAKMGDAAQIVGFRTQVGTAVPVAPAPVGAAALPVQQMDAFPWERDALILRAPDAPPLAGAAIEESTASPEEQMAEAYQLMRLSLSRWLQRDARGPAMRRDLAALLKLPFPLYEKRKRLDITLEPLLREWISAEQTEVRRALPLLRKDCLAITTEGDCTETCRWSGGRCLIHAPFRTEGTDPVRILTARLSDELLRYPIQRREILDASVSAIRTPRGVVRVGDELYMATLPKEGPPAILSRLGFTGHVAMSFPEEMLRFDGLEEEVPAAAVAAAEAGGPVAPLPASWTEKGLTIPDPAAALTFDEARRLAFAAATGRDIEEWETFIRRRRVEWKLPGDPERPFQFSVQDLYVLSRIGLTNIILAHAAPDGRIVIDRWISPTSQAQKVAQPMYTIFWGPRQLIVSKGKGWRFNVRDLPADFLTAIDGASPMTEEEARGFVEEPAAVAEEALDVGQLAPPAEAPAIDGNAGQLPPPQPAPVLEAAAEGGVPALVVAENV